MFTFSLVLVASMFIDFGHIFIEFGSMFIDFGSSFIDFGSISLILVASVCVCRWSLVEG